MTPEQNAKLTEFVDFVFNGMHNAPQPVEVHHFYWSLKFSYDASTFDGSLLTRIVYAAHRLAIRAELHSTGKRMELTLHPRVREGKVFERHPDLETVIQGWDKQTLWREELFHATDTGANEGQT